MPGRLATCTDDDLIARLLAARIHAKAHTRCGSCIEGRTAAAEVDDVLDEMSWRQTHAEALT